MTLRLVTSFGRQSYRRQAYEGGFTLVEIALALAVLGVIASAAAAAYLEMFSASRTNLNGYASLATMSGAVIAFTRSHNRLPCPDSAGSGNEGLVSGSCPAGLDVGWFPYLAVGLTSPPSLARAIYGVYRGVGANCTKNSEQAGTDLARAEEQPPAEESQAATNPDCDVIGSAHYANGADLVRALKKAASLPVSNARIYLTGDGVTTGAEDCGGNVVTNPAFVVLVPGEDRDGDGNPQDGIHQTLPVAGRCFAAPTRTVAANFDDRTLALSFYELMAKLNTEP